MNGPNAGISAIEIFEWLTQNEEIFLRFLGQSGLSIADIGKIADTPDFLLGVMDFILSDEAHARKCSEDLGLLASELTTIRSALPGGQEINWT